jgi:hypothetical protein
MGELQLTTQRLSVQFREPSRIAAPGQIIPRDTRFWQYAYGAVCHFHLLRLPCLTLCACTKRVRFIPAFVSCVLNASMLLTVKILLHRFC